ncbi:MAG TPA: NADH-quinone oxidoreductase subunit C [Bryobacteraceae bacterium]|nr:NADH-quinone oxidoreductase subunit C [Bryobacteraceae bacterium]HPT25438.1 NADH-quinone oxidoreductase subunit C [Bryobacteraceae bacterium]
MPEEANPGGATEPQKPEETSAQSGGGEPSPPPNEAAPTAPAPSPTPPIEAPAPAAKAPAPAAAKAAVAAAAKPAAPAAPKAPAVMQTTPWEGELVEDLKEEFGERIKEYCTYAGQNFLVSEPGAVIPIIEYLKLEQNFDYLVDITAVDYPAKPERFELIWVLYSFERNQRIRIKTRVKDGEKAVSCVRVHLTADWLEREVYDMFGVEFEGHPNMTRILLPEGWCGFPLRKDKSITDMDNRWVRENVGIESGQ